MVPTENSSCPGGMRLFDGKDAIRKSQGLPHVLLVLVAIYVVFSVRSLFACGISGIHKNSTQICLLASPQVGPLTVSGQRAECSLSPFRSATMELLHDSNQILERLLTLLVS